MEHLPFRQPDVAATKQALIQNNVLGQVWIRFDKKSTNATIPFAPYWGSGERGLGLTGCTTATAVTGQSASKSNSELARPPGGREQAKAPVGWIKPTGVAGGIDDTANRFPRECWARSGRVGVRPATSEEKATIAPASGAAARTLPARPCGMSKFRCTPPTLGNARASGVRAVALVGHRNGP